MEEKREKDQENDTASAGPSQIGIHMITNRFPVIRKDATKEHGAISYPVTSCERMNVHVGGLIPFAWERPDNGGFYWFSPEEIPKDCAEVLAECLGVALHESKPDLFGSSVKDPLRKAAQFDGMYEGKNGFWRHIWNVAEVVLDQQRWRHFPDSMIREMSHPRGFMQTLLLDKYDGCYSLGFRVSSWERRRRDGPLRMFNDIVYHRVKESTNVYHDYTYIKSDILYQRCFGMPYVGNQGGNHLRSISVQDLPDDIDDIDELYKGFTAAMPKEVAPNEGFIGPPPYWSDAFTRLEETVNNWDLDKVLDALYGESSEVCKHEKQMFRQYGQRLLLDDSQSQFPCYYAGLPTMAKHKEGFNWWALSNTNTASFFYPKQKISWASDYYSRIAASAWDRVDAGLRSLRASRLSAEEDYTSKEFGGFPNGRHYRPRLHSPYDPLNKYRLLSYRDQIEFQSVVESKYDIGGQPYVTDEFEFLVEAQSIGRKTANTWICGNDDLNMQF